MAIGYLSYSSRRKINSELDNISNSLSTSINNINSNINGTFYNSGDLIEWANSKHETMSASFSSSCTNLPASGNFDVTRFEHGGFLATMIAIRQSDRKIFISEYNTVRWSDWTEYATKSDVDDKASGNFKKFGLNTSGWYRFAIYDSSRTVEAQGSIANSTMFNIKQTFNYCNNLSIFGVLNSSYMKSNISILGESVSNQTITKIRHTVDTVNNKAYLEFYYNTNTINKLSCEVIGSKDEVTRWYILDELVPTSESVDVVDVYSIADLTSKNRNLVTNTELNALLNREYFTVANGTHYTKKLEKGIYLLFWGQFGVWNQRGMALLFIGAKDEYYNFIDIIFQNDTTSLTFSIESGRILKIVNNVIASLTFTIIKISS